MEIRLIVVNLQHCLKPSGSNYRAKPKLIAVKSEQIIVSRRFPGLLFVLVLLSDYFYTIVDGEHFVFIFQDYFNE